MSRQHKWLLSIYVSDLNVEKTLEVTGQTFVGNLMVELVNRLGTAPIIVLVKTVLATYECRVYESKMQPIF